MNYMYLLYGYVRVRLGFELWLLACNYASFIVIIMVSKCNVLQGHLKIKYIYVFIVV